ncbi:MAG: response regulator [Bacteroidales bacterium]|nr:response regulator [Bacteroidales bacterium]MCF8458416.1 response regulator [Bacteroidales bacterium]
MENNFAIYNWKGKTILIVEDEHSNFYLAQTFLSKGGATIVGAMNGEEAVEYCRKNPNLDMVLMDIKMPEMNGYEATRIIKKENPSLPVIALTAFALDGDREKSLMAGCDDYMSKPIDQAKLLDLVNRYI